MRLITLLIPALFLAACATTPPDNVGNACKIFEEKQSWYRATHKAQRKYGTPKALQLAIIRQESSFQHNAKPPRGRFLFIFPGKRLSSARGYPQALDTTWDLYKRETGRGGAERDEFDDAAMFVAWYVRRTSKMTGIPVDDPYQQYLAYHEGPDGYLRGTYENKPAVKRAATTVSSVYATYQRQLDGCEKKFRRNIPLIPFI